MNKLIKIKSRRPLFLNCNGQESRPVEYSAWMCNICYESLQPDSLHTHFNLK
jgi:hypothetical protein